MPNSKQIIEALLPPGNLWSPQAGYDFDRLLDGIGGNTDAIIAFLETIAKTRDPLLTPFLSDLEIDFGILPNDTIAEAVRRQRLFAVKTRSDSTGTGEWLQEALQDAGFTVQVHTNDPAVDPATILNFDTSVIFGTPGNQFGTSPDQFVAVGTSALLVNGDIRVAQAPVVYANPPSQYFPQVWFIGGTGVRDGGGHLTSLDWAQVATSRKTEFISTILKYKPMHTWVGLKIDYN